MSQYRFLTDDKLQLLQEEVLDALEHSGFLTADEIDYIFIRFDAWLDFNTIGRPTKAVSLFNEYPVTMFSAFIQGYLVRHLFEAHSCEAEKLASEAINKIIRK